MVHFSLESKQNKFASLLSPASVTQVHLRVFFFYLCLPQLNPSTHHSSSGGDSHDPAWSPTPQLGLWTSGDGGRVGGLERGEDCDVLLPSFCPESALWGQRVWKAPVWHEEWNILTHTNTHTQACAQIRTHIHSHMHAHKHTCAHTAHTEIAEGTHMPA